MVNYRCGICQNTWRNEKVSFFAVPKDAIKRNRWIAACGVNLQDKSKVCEKHFVSSDFINTPEAATTKKLRLFPNSVPSVFYGASKVPLQPLSSLEDVCNIQQGPVVKRARLSQCAYPLLSNNTQELHHAVTNVDCCTQTDNDFLKSCEFLQIMDLKKQVKKLELEVSKLKQQEEETNNVTKALKRIFTDGQIRKLRNPNKMIHWDWNDISNAISLHAAGPKAYTHLYKNGFPLPSTDTLAKWAQNVKIEEGILTFAIDYLKTADLSVDKRICILSFDEMKIATGQKHDPTLDLVRTPCNHVQVAMIRGLKESWQQPVFYGFDTKMSKTILYELIQTLYKAGYPVVGIVSDMGSSNQVLWKELNVTTEKTWFENPANPEEKVFVFANVPRLLKLIRNRFLESGLIFRNSVVTPRTIKEMMQHAAGSAVSIPCKLTEEHLSVHPAGRQKVKLAVQLLSNTTANAIRRCYSLGKELYNPCLTADFIQLMNNWFNVFNSKLSTVYNIPSKKAYGKEIFYQNEVLDAMNAFMSQPIVPNKKSLAPFQRGVLMCNTSLTLLYEYVKGKYGVECIFTNRLNQDLLQRLFGAIRSNEGLHDHPSQKQFKCRMRKYMLAVRTTKNVCQSQ